MTPEDHPLARLLGKHYQPVRTPPTNGVVPGAPRAPSPAGAPGEHGRYAQVALDDECATVATTAPGGRNHQLNTSAYSIGQLVGAGLLDERDAAAALEAAGLASGLDAKEVAATVRSGLFAGQLQPRVVPALEPAVDLPDTTFGTGFSAPEDHGALNPSAPQRAGELGALDENPAATTKSSAPEDHGALGALDETELRQRLFDTEVAHELRRLLIRDEAWRQRNQQRRSLGAPRPDGIWLTTALDQPDEDVPWLIPGWLPATARVLLAAQYKAGKTTLVGNLVRCLVDGDHWLGRYPVTPLDGAVAVLDLEMHPAQLVRWLRDQNIAHPEKVLLIAARGGLSHLDLTDAAVRADWANQMRAAGVRFVVLDCLRPLLDALGLDEHSDAGQLLVALDALLAEAGILGCLVVHHMGHTGERSRGDSRIRDWPDVEWRLVRATEEPSSTRYISAFGRDVEVPETELGYNSLSRHLVIGDGNRRDAVARAALADVLAVLDEAQGGLSLRHIERELAESDHSRVVVRAAVALGVRLRTITQRPGPCRSTLHFHTPLQSPLHTP